MRSLVASRSFSAGCDDKLKGFTEPIDATPRPFHDRPYEVLDAGRFTTALLNRITDPHVAALPVIGAIDQFADNTDLLGGIERCRATARAALGNLGL